MRKRMMALLLAVSLTACFMVGCSGSGQSGSATASGKQEESSVAEQQPSSTEEAKEPVEIVYWDENAGPNRTPYHEELIKRFHEAQDEVKVVYEAVPWESAKQKFDVAIATGVTPDATHCAAAWGSDFLAQEALLPLDDYFNAWDQKDYINESYLDLNRGLDPDGRLFMIPVTVATPLMWVRTDWFEEAGLELPTTWDLFFEAAEKLTDKSQNRYGFSIRGGAGSCVEFQHAMYGYSGISSYFDENGKCTVNDPDNVEFLERIVALYKKYTPESDITNGYKEMCAAFDGGSVAMIFHSTGSYAEHAAVFEQDQFQAMPFPESKRGTYTWTAGSQGGYCIFKNSKVPDETWKYISWLASEDQNSYWNEMIGQIPMNNRVLEHSWINEQPHLKKAMETMNMPNCKLVEQPKYLPDYSKILEQDCPPNFQAVMSGSMTAQEMLDIWANEFTEAYAEYKG